MALTTLEGQTPKTALILLVYFLWLPGVYSAEQLLTKAEILSYDRLDNAECKAAQSFEKAGPDDTVFYAHTVTERYLAGGRCSPMSSNAALYKAENGRYRKIWDKGHIAAAQRVYFSIHNHDNYSVLLFDYSDGGNAQFPHQEAYIIEDGDVIKKIDESAVKQWATSQLSNGQRIHYLTHVNYEGDEIKYNARISNKNDHYRHPTGGSLSAELKIIKHDNTYRLALVNAYNIGKANYFNDRGLKEYRESDYKEAINWFKKSVAEYPSHWQAWTNLGLAYYKTGDFENSIEGSLTVFKNSVDVRAQSNASFNIGLAYEAQGDLDSALKYYKISNEFDFSMIRTKKIKELESKLVQKN